jgi:DNA modification methylase/DNA-directed RNA polymerase subunit RPC12/RpoP
MAEAIKDLDHLTPIDHAVIAKPHTPVYKMHRYFARRPWSVFRELIEHYSNPGSIVLDPFCGGGVTVVEGLRLGRKVIGVDLNPLATFITRMEVTDADLGELQESFEAVEAACRREIEDLYLTTCPSCGQRVPADWFEWSNVYACPHCRTTCVISNCGKPKPGLYKCKSCRKTFAPLDAKRLRQVLVKVSLRCSACGFRGIVDASKSDKAKANQTERDPSPEVSQAIPRDLIPDGNMPRENALSRRGILRFSDFFTKRNLVANALLRNASRGQNNHFLLLAFSASLKTTNNLVQRVKGFAGGQPEWSRHAFWPPEVSGELNVWRAFARSYLAVRRGKRHGITYLGANAVEANHFDDLVGKANFWIMNGSSHDLPVPNDSVDAIITDPPYGSNVQYLEMSNFWLVWMKDELGITLNLSEFEAIETRRQGIPNAKSHGHYMNMLLRIFKECHRVLKPGRWMVMTFHNKKFSVWNALHLAAHDAGFRLPEHDAMIYQPPIRLYEAISHTKSAGSMLGDFVLSFQKVATVPKFKILEHAEIGRQLERLAAEAVLHHRGATLSVIYMKLMPWLLNNNLLDKIGEKEVVPYLQANFEEREGLWRLKDRPDQALKEALEAYSRQHYKASYEELGDFVPVEARIEYLIRRLLYARGFATQDDILNAIYENLINSNMADVREIQRVLESIAELVPLTQAAAGKVSKGKGGRKVWKLKEDIERERLWRQMGAEVEIRTATSEESDHDLAIARLVELAALRNLKAHIGKTEQTKYTEFRRLSSPLPARVQGMPAAARDIIEQIDVLWHNGGRGLVAAFEVERTTTIDSGINRFRNLLAAAPEMALELYVVAPQSRADEVRRKIGSPANRKDGLHRKIAYVYLEDLKIRAGKETDVDLAGLRHFVQGE